MCEAAAKNPAWHPPVSSQRVPVGYIDEGYTLLSEAKDPQGVHHAIWVRSNRSPLYIIDRISERNGKWGYTRAHSCNILECAVRTYLRLVNPSSPY